MMKRILSMLLMAVMLLSACSFAAFAEEDAIHASAVVFTSPGFTPKADTYGVQYIRDNFGLDLEVLPVDDATSESWNIFWASDGYADIIIPYGLNEARSIVNEDICRTIDFEMIVEYAPRLYTLLLSIYGTDEEILKNLTFDGDVYCIPYFAVTNNISWVSAIRNDWLEAVNLEVPTTIDELTEVLRAFTEDDPDGNGVDDTYGVNSIPYGLWNVPAAFGTSDALAFWLSDDGTDITTNAVSEEYRTFLRQVAEWYAAGYIDPEFITDDRAAIRSKFATGKMGIYCDNPWWLEQDRGATNPLQMLCDTDSGVDFATGFSIFGGLKNGDAEPAVLSNFGDIKGQASVYFGYDCPDEVVIKMLEMINQCVVMYDGTEEDHASMQSYAEMQIGVEGTDWEWSEDGKQIVTLVERTPEVQNEKGIYMFPVASNLDLTRFEGRADEFVIDAYNISMGLNKIYRGTNFSAPELSTEVSDMYDMVNNYFTEAKNKFITGEMSLDTDWDAYVEQIEAYGLSKIIDEYKAGLGI